MGVPVITLPGRTFAGRHSLTHLANAGLSELLVRVQDESSPQLVTLVGVPGIGKSRLVHELMQIVHRGGVLTYWRRGRSLPYGEAVPTYIW